MPWPSTVNNGQLTDASQYNNLLTSVQTWGGPVSANSNALTNITAISAPTATALNITASPVTYLSPDASHNVQISVGNTGNPTLSSTSNSILTTSTWTFQHTSGIAVMSPDGTRTGRFANANGGDPTITTSTSTIALGGLVKISNGLIVYATNMASGIFYTFSFVTQNSVASCHTLTVTGAAGILYIASPVSMLSLTAAGLATLNNGVSVAGNATIADTLTVTSATNALLNVSNTGGTGGPRTLSLSVPSTGSAATIYSPSAILTQITFSNIAIATTGAGGFLAYSPDASHVLQINCANAANPVISTNTGWVIFTSNIGFQNGSGWVVYGPGTSTGSYLSTAWQGPHPALASSTGQLVINNAATIQGTLNVAGAASIGAVLNVTGNLGLNAGGVLYVYNSGNTQSVQIGCSTVGAVNSTTGTMTSNAAWTFSGSVGCSSFSSPGTVDAAGASAALRALNGANIIWYNTSNAVYGQLVHSNGHPAFVTSTGWFSFNGNIFFGAAATFDLSLTRYSAGNLLVADTSGTPASILAGNFTAYNSTKAAYVYMNGGTSPPAIVTNATQLNCQTPVLYVTGSVSALAHNIHGSGTDIADIHKSFLRKQGRSNDAGEVIEPVVPPNSWGLTPADDGLHILVKRATGEVREFILPWEQSKLVN